MPRGARPDPGRRAACLISGCDGHHRELFGAVGGDDRVPVSAGGDDGVQVPQDCRGDHGLGLGGGELVVVKAASAFFAQECDSTRRRS